MSLDKAIKYGKEHRRGYKERGKPGEWDRTCRPNGGCPYCERSRLLWRAKFRELNKLEKSDDR